MWYESAWFVYPALVVAGFIAGVVNTLAGGGSFLTLPVLMYLAGLDPKLANGTNRVAILLSTGSAASVFYKHGHIEKRAVMRMFLPMLVGTPIGAQLAIYLPVDWFRGVFGAIFLLMAVVLCLNPKAMLKKDRQPVRSRVAEAAVFFGIGLYVGFIQAGFGLLMLVSMSLFHARELVGTNAVKNAIGFLITIVAVAMFLFHGQIVWKFGLTMAIGNLLGGFAGAHLALRKGERLIFVFLIVVMVATGIKMLIDAVG